MELCEQSHLFLVGKNIPDFFWKSGIPNIFLNLVCRRSTVHYPKIKLHLIETDIQFKRKNKFQKT